MNNLLKYRIYFNIINLCEVTLRALRLNSHLTEVENYTEIGIRTPDVIAKICLTFLKTSHCWTPLRRGVGIYVEACILLDFHELFLNE